MDIVFTTTPVVDVPFIPFVSIKDHAENAVPTFTPTVYEASNIGEYNRKYNTNFRVTYTWTVLPNCADERPREVRYVNNIDGDDESPSYVPSAQDIGHRIKLFCTIRARRTSSEKVLLRRSQTFISQPVLPFPPIMELRHQQRTLDFGALRRRSPILKMMSYNVLNDHYSNTHARPYVPSWVPARTFKRRKQIEEILITSPDLICLQEVHRHDFEDIFLPPLQKSGYQGLFALKEFKEGREFWYDGCAIFFRTSMFELVDYKSLLLYKLARERIFANTQEKLGFPLPGPVAQIAHLQWKLERRPVDIIIINIHLSGVYKITTHICAIVILYNELFEFMRSRGLHTHATPIIFAGDFNAAPKGFVTDFIKTGLVNLNTKPLEPIRGIINKTPGLRLNFRDWTFRSGLADANFPKFEEPLYTLVNMNQARAPDYIYYRGNALMPIACTIPSISNMSRDLERARGKSVSPGEVAWPNEMSPSDHEAVFVHFVLDAFALSQRQRPRLLSQRTAPPITANDIEFTYRVLSNKIASIIDNKKPAKPILFGDVIEDCVNFIIILHSHESSFLRVLSGILTVVVFSRLHYEYGYTAETRKDAKLKLEQRTADYETVRKNIEDLLRERVTTKTVPPALQALMDVGYTNMSKNDNIGIWIVEPLREPRTRKLLSIVELWLRNGGRRSNRNVWENFMKIDCERDQFNYDFPRCERNNCRGHGWHYDLRPPLIVKREEEELRVFMMSRLAYLRENNTTFHNLLLDVFSRRSEIDPVRPKYSPRRSTVETITTVIYDEIVELYKIYFSAGKSTGIVFLEDTGYTDQIRKTDFEKVRKPWLANQIKWYWCQVRSEPYAIFERLLQLFPTQTLRHLTGYQITDQRDVLRKFLFTPLPFHIEPALRAVRPRASTLRELPCFGVLDVRALGRDRDRDYTRLLGVKDNQVDLNVQISETESLLYW